MEPNAIPQTKPAYIPISPIWNMNPNNPANITSRMNALRIVKIRDIVPFPMPWNRFPATIPNGINNKKKTRILIASATLWDNIALSAEYEKM